MSLARLTRRAWRGLRTGEAFCGGSTESWRPTFSGDSVPAWHHRSFDRKHDEAVAWASDAGGPPVVRSTSPRQVTAWLRGLKHSPAGSHPDSR